MLKAQAQEILVNGQRLTGTCQELHWIGHEVFVAVQVGTAVKSFPLRYVIAPDNWLKALTMTPDKFKEIVLEVMRAGQQVTTGTGT